MTEIKLLRWLSGLAFLLLLAPFYDQCNGGRLKNNEEKPAEEIVPTEEIDSSALVVVTDKDSAMAATPSGGPKKTFSATNLYDFIDDADSESGFEMMRFGMLTVSLFYEEEILSSKWTKFYKLSFKKQVGIVAAYAHFWSFIFIVPLTFAVFVLSLRRCRWLPCLVKINAVFLIVAIVSLLLSESFESWSQVKWGYYAFAIAIGLQFFLVRKLFNGTKT